MVRNSGWFLKQQPQPQPNNHNHNHNNNNHNKTTTTKQPHNHIIHPNTLYISQFTWLPWKRPKNFAETMAASPVRISNTEGLPREEAIDEFIEDVEDIPSLDTNRQTGTESGCIMILMIPSPKKISNTAH
jgi:hypothetical protein